VAIVFSQHYGGARPFVVVENSVDEDMIGRALKRLSPNLFLEKRLRTDGTPVWAVTEHVGERAGATNPYRTVCYWSDPVTNEAWPLTWRLIDKVASLEGGLDGMVARIDEHNARITQTANRELREAVDYMAHDMEPRMRETRSAVLHRSVGLRMARDKRRARGEKC
jgi:hypothetical protein